MLSSSWSGASFVVCPCTANHHPTAPCSAATSAALLMATYVPSHLPATVRGKVPGDAASEREEQWGPGGRCERRSTALSGSDLPAAVPYGPAPRLFVLVRGLWSWPRRPCGIPDAG
jgi:hypothetical protein